MHWPVLHVVVPCALLQARSQAPQLAAWLRSVSQPLAAAVSQSPNPVAQLGAHKPSEQLALPCAFVQTRPHVPQLEIESSVLSSQPFAGSLSQSS
jgi:hypothetical protein